MTNHYVSDYEISNVYDNSSSFENSECIKKEKKIKLKMKKERIYKQKTHGSWGMQEEHKFSSFMLAHRKIFENKSSRRRNKIFRQMAKFICTRSSEQCRSHHQKYEIRFVLFDKIIAYIENKLHQNSNEIDSEFAKNVVKREFFENCAELQKQCPINKLNFLEKNSLNKNPNISENKEKNQSQTMTEGSENILEKNSEYLLIKKESKKLELKVLLNIDLFYE